MTMSIALQTPGVHHIALRSSDLERSRRFYAETLGLPLALQLPNLLIFLAGSTAVAVRGPEVDTPKADRFSPFRVGLDHVALACSHEEELERVAGALARADVPSTGVKTDEVLGKRYVAFKDPDGIAWELYMAANPAVQAVESYLDALRRKDLSRVPFAPSVSFESPLSPRVVGVKAVSELLTGMFPVIKDVRVRQHIVENEYVATRFDLDTTFGVIPVFDCFRVANGLIQEVRPFYDPRPITNAAA
jgi:catechol 2,3-dioxygenase-like lactoylglutathione lyase family enzyme